MRVIREVGVHYSDFISWKGTSSFVSTSKGEEDSGKPPLTYLHLELARVRPGMETYLLRVSTPKYDIKGKSNTIVTMRCTKAQGSASGIAGTATTVVKEMQKRGDATFDWAAINLDHLATLIAPSLKFFASNPSAEKLLVSTEALA